ncbi:hypothetical protein ACIPL1_21115 [Pseudomonas sp. NPDC090202]|uniref:hypothetical protein n=1 Tax=unclassified Pseudomonas TaxID=196821 RepID=UPI0037FA2942
MAQSIQYPDITRRILHALKPGSNGRELARVKIGSIASATLQQSHVVEDLNQNVTQAAQLKGLSEQLNGLLRQFRV